MAYLVKVQCTATNSDGDSTTHFAGDVISDWELTEHIKEQIAKGVPWYIGRFEALTNKEATLYRKKATAIEGKRSAPNGQIIDPPWDDFIGLHPKEVIERMKDLSFEDVEAVRQYERAGLNRSVIIEYVAPSEREPWHDYDSWGVRDILEKMDILDDATCQDVIVYEMNHKKRPAVIEYNPDEQKASPQNDEENSDDSGKVVAGVGASTVAGEQP